MERASDPFYVRDKVVVLTGASTGIGKHLVTVLLSHGATVCVLLRSEKAKADFREDFGDVHVFHADLRDSEAIDSAIDQIIAKFGKIDVLLNVAGVWHDNERAFKGPLLWETSSEEIAEVLGTGLLGGMSITRKVLPFMVDRKDGRVVFLTCGFESEREASGWTHYYVANQAIEALSRAIAAEVRPYSIRVNCVAPWFVKTEAVEKFFPHEIATALELSEVSDTVMFLLSKAASSITGQAIQVRSQRDV